MSNQNSGLGRGEIKPLNPCWAVRAKKKTSVRGSDQINKDGSKDSKRRLFPPSWVEFRITSQFILMLIIWDLLAGELALISRRPRAPAP